jgi:hypothetical protein
MINFVDKNPGLGIIIAAGYEHEMETRFMAANQGMNRRFPNLFKLSDYDARQLTNILLSFLEDELDASEGSNKNRIELSDGDASVLYTIINYLMTTHKEHKVFSKQAGDMKNLANIISKTVYGHKSLHWTNGDTRTNSSLLTIGVNRYLASRGLSIKYENLKHN